MTIRLVCTALERYIYYIDTERGPKNITIFQKNFVGACPPPPPYQHSKRAAIRSLFLYEDDHFFILTCNITCNIFSKFFREA